MIFKDNLPTSLAGVLKGDYRMDGREELICCSVDGEGLSSFFGPMHSSEYMQSFKGLPCPFLVRGYLPASPQFSDNLMGVDVAQEALRDLTQKRQHLLLELKNYEENMKVWRFRSNSSIYSFIIYLCSCLFVYVSSKTTCCKCNTDDYEMTGNMQQLSPVTAVL